MSSIRSTDLQSLSRRGGELEMRHYDAARLRVRTNYRKNAVLSFNLYFFFFVNLIFSFLLIFFFSITSSENQASRPEKLNRLKQLPSKTCICH